jgi:hypothetical protein
MGYDYRIETLGSVFTKFANEVDEHNAFLIQRHKKNYSDEPIPKEISENFNLARALSIMAYEIIEGNRRCLELLRSYEIDKRIQKLSEHNE